MSDNPLLASLYLGFLIFVRMSAIFLSAQSLIARVPATIRLYMLVSISLFVFISVDYKLTLPTTTLQLVSSLLVEVVLGMVLSIGVIALLSALSFVGRTLDLQIGFGAANIIDPTTNNSEALIGTIFTTCAITLFFVLDMHSVFIYGVSNSLGLVPFGHLPETITVDKILTYLSAQYILGLSLILPTMVGLLALDLVIAYTSKSMPQMNIYFVSLPLKIGVGIFLLFITIPASSSVFKNMFTTLERFWLSILGQ